MPLVRAPGSRRSGSLRQLPRGPIFWGAMAVSVLLVLGLGALGLWDDVENGLWHGRVKYFSAREPLDPRIGLITIDASSLQMLEKYGFGWPWPRSLYANIIEFARAGKAEAVIFALEFTEPSNYAGSRGDEVFAAAMDSGLAVVVPVALGSGDQAQWPAELAHLRQRLDDPEHWLSAASAETADFPVPEIGSHATQLGDFSADADRDGVFRRARLGKIFDGNFVPSLSFAALMAGRTDSPGVRERELVLGDLRAPIDRSGDAILRFRKPRSAKEWSAGEILASNEALRAGSAPAVAPAELAGRYLFVGKRETDVAFATPIAEAMPAAEFHATALDNLLTNSFFRRAAWHEVAILLLLFMALGASIALAPARTWLGVVLAVPVVLAALGVGYLGYAAGVWIPAGPMATGALVAAIAAVLLRHRWESRARAHLEKSFRHYLPPQVIDRMLDDPSLLRLGGERKLITVFFSDIQGFTTLSERNDPETVVTFLNEFLEDMGNIIIGHGGTIDKYVGDAIVAFWNAPLESPDHANQAAQAALECQALIADQNAKYQGLMQAAIRMRIGLTTGHAIVGNLGSTHRFNYTAIGDCMNLAARLEAANKAMGSSILVSEAMRDACDAGLPFRDVGDLKLDGKSQPLRVFEVMTTKPTEAELERFAQGLAAWRCGQVDSAAEHFAALPNDPVAARYLVRCRESAVAEAVLTIHKD